MPEAWGSRFKSPPGPVDNHRWMENSGRFSMMRRFRKKRYSRGFTLLEAMVCLTILSIVGLGASVGLQSVAHNPDQAENRLWTCQQLNSTLEDLRDTAYASLLSGSKTTDADHDGATHTLTWTVLEIDPARPTASPPVAKPNSGLKQITVSLNGFSSVTWISQ
jgi:prepilin-type N-terminal cleavage/methylation domain-containing protein